MSKLAQDLIAQAKQQRLKFLDLGNCDLTTIPDELLALSWLEGLNLGKWSWDNKKQWEETKNKGKQNKITDVTLLAALVNLNLLGLSFNKITDIVSLASLVNLRKLDLESNQITDIVPLASLVNLKVLDLNSNKITDIVPLASLVNLSYLDLKSNKITDIVPLASLVNLSTLDLRSNKITEIVPLASLVNLSYLDLNSNKITDIVPLANLVNIIKLLLSSNQITDIVPLTNLVNLNILELSSNQITDIVPLANLVNLSQLILRSNNITDIVPLASLVNLNKLDLNYNQIQSLQPLLALIKQIIEVKIDYNFSKTVFVEKNPLIHPPISIIEQGNAAIINYFEQIQQQGGTTPVYEAKLILVGEGGAGKTSLMEKLLNPDYKIPQPTDSTIGIQVKEGWTFNMPQQTDIEFSANIWDFGGQEIQYMTHQFFLTPSAVYVLLADNRRQHTNFAYWFKIIHLLGEEERQYSPVLVVLNDKEHKSVSNFDLRLYKQRYPELSIQLYDVDLSVNNARYQLLRETIQQQLCQLPHVGYKLPKQWAVIRQALRQRAEQNNYISFADYQQICQKYEVNREADQLLLSSYLHKLGSMLHFQKDSVLRDFIILNPQWAVDAVYSVLEDKQVASNNGCFKQSTLEGIWSNYNYIEQGHLFNLMKKDNFEICYPVEGQDKTYIAPQLLSEVQPKYSWQAQDSLKFRYLYRFMPEGIITRLIVRLHEWIKRQDKIDLVWLKGMILNKNNCQAQIIEDESSKEGLKVIDIEIIGKADEKKYVLRLIREEIDKLHKKWFANVDVEQMIPCCCDYCIDNKHPTYFEFSELEQYQQEDMPTIICRKEKIKPVQVKALLEGVFSTDDIKQQKQQQQGTVQNITINGGIANVGTKQSDHSETHNEVSQQTSPTPEKQLSWSQKWWWQISLGSGLLAGLISGFAFNSLIVGIITVLLITVVIFSFNPKYRYRRAAIAVLGMLALNNTTFFRGDLSFLYKLEQGWFNINGQMGDTANPWISFLLIGLAAFLFWLDAKQK